MSYLLNNKLCLDYNNVSHSDVFPYWYNTFNFVIVDAL